MMLEDQHPQDDGGWRPQAAPPPTLRVALGQGLGDAIDEDFVIEKRIDLAESGIAELVAVGQEHFHEAALPVRSPHHGASGEAASPHRVHRVSCAAAQLVRSRGFLTMAHRSGGQWSAGCRRTGRWPAKARATPHEPCRSESREQTDERLLGEAQSQDKQGKEYGGLGLPGELLSRKGRLSWGIEGGWRTTWLRRHGGRAWRSEVLELME
jgi:hypothetical protein